ncbi:MAG: DUF2491 family protein [Pseudomonadota bacterium]
MAWKDAYNYAGKLFNRASNDAQESHHAGQREDANLPLNARIGSVIALQKSPLIRAISQGSLIALPDEGETLIRAISRIQTGMAGNLYRYYLHVGDDVHAEKFLQLYASETGEISEVMYCSRLTRLIPATTEDQEAYLGEAGYGLGDSSYTLWRSQVEDLGMDEADVTSIFADAENLLYQRDVGTAEQDFVSPFRGVETRIDDALGKQGLKQDIVFMPYSRQLGGEHGDQREILLISTEIVESEDGDRAKRGIYVDFMIAIPVELERLVVQ